MTTEKNFEPPQAGARAQSQRLSRMRARASELDGRGSWEASAQLRQEILQLERQSIGNEHIQTLSDMHDLARTYTESGQLEKAGALYLEVISARKRLLGEEHPETLRTMQDYAWMLMKLGNLKEAKPILVEVIRAQKQVLDQDDPDTLASMHNLSWAYLRTGDLEEAEELSTQVVEARRRLLGDEHPDTLDIMHNLANVYRQQNRLGEAAELYRQIVEASGRALGSEHVDTLHSMRCLASTYVAQGQLNEAEAMYGRIVSTQKDALGEEHPDTLDSMHRLASTIYKQGRHKEAEMLFLQVVAARGRVLGEDEPSTLKSVHSLASTYRRQGRLKKAEELFRRAASGRKSVLGESHRDTIASSESLGRVYQKQSKWADAERLELELLEIRKKLLGEDHPSTLGSMRVLARIYTHQKRREEAEKFEAALKERSSTLLRPPSVVSYASSLASEQSDSFPTAEPEPPHANSHVKLPRSASSSSPVDGKKKRNETIQSEPKPTLLPKSTASLKVPSPTTNDRSASRSAYPINRDAYSAIDEVIRELHMCTLSFQYPDDLDFEVSSPNSLLVPRLAFTSKNKPFLEQVRKLEDLQGKPDKIDSHDDPDIKNARKQTGMRVERALADLEWAQALVWDKYNEDAPSHGEFDSPQDSDISSFMVSEDSGHLISQETPVEDVFDYLLDHGCLDCTSMLDISKCSKAALAGGSFGDVWRGAFYNGTQIAIKCLRLHTDIESSVKSVKRGARELYNWSKARHENVLELTGIAMFRGQLAMISPWMDNGTLSAYIHKNPSVDRWALCLQVAEGLAYMHSINMVHGDLKGANVFVSDKGIAKLGDFGHSILQHHSLSFTATTNIGGGTARWMAPELLMDDDEHNSADRSMPADVYALGMTILEVVTAKLPYSEYRSEPRVTMVITQGIQPRRPSEMSSSVKFGDARWNMLLASWSMEANSRPTAHQVRDMVLRFS
ncbi:hypothetical protein BDV93DRAFT_527688 [Ceratobasidium sp. AG-I]|nr:hypothetical protein BDV93DRAFT_527688 [Ceratobasidium sp. AG-I]